MAKLRVHELAKELGTTSKNLLGILKEQGEFVKSASSTIEAPVVRRIREQFPKGVEDEKKPAAKGTKKTTKTTKKAATPKAAAKKATASSAPKPGPKTKKETPKAKAEAPAKPAAKPAANAKGSPKAAPKPAAKPGPKPAAKKPAAKPAPAKPAAAKKAAPKPGAHIPTPKAAVKSAQKAHEPRPGNNPFASSQGMPRPGGSRRPGPRPGPRPGNNPYASAQGMPKPGGRGRSNKPGSGAKNRRPSGPRPNPNMMPERSKLAEAQARAGQNGKPGNRDSRRGGRGGSGGPRGGFGGPRGGRGGRGSTQGAFGRGGGSKLVTVMFHLGEMVTANQSLDQDTFEALGAELGYVVKIVSPEDEDRELLESFDIDLEAEEADDIDNMVPRPPVVTVMGHVDHGKTKLLDAIRHTDVVGGEHGGITQHIGAYQVKVSLNDEDRAVTFIDTPGHEAFTAMRARGAQSTDIAIIVVAADDGVMPQTVEAINHAQSADVPIVVAVNKVDKPEAKPDKIRAQLTEYNLVAEEYGGDVMFVDISAKQRTGIQELLEAVLLTADAALDLKANPDAEARGTAIEANLDKGRGAVATMLVQRGTLRVGDALVVGNAHGRVRAMFDDRGNSVKEAGPSCPVQVLGLTSVPRAGDSFLVAPDDRTARQIADKREAAERQAQLAKRRKRISLEDFDEALKEGKVETLNLIIKGDVSGAVEALEDSLLKIEVSDEVQLRIIHRGVGAITQNDVNLATVDNAVIIGFNVRPAERVAELADSEGVDIKYYSVIYAAIEDVENALKGMLKPIYEEVELGKAEILQVFKSGKFGNIAGSIVRSGKIKRGTKARLIRDSVVVAPDLEIASLRREKDDVTEVRDGYECGITLGHKDIQVGDIIETWEMREKPRD